MSTQLLHSAIAVYRPLCEQEVRDQAIMLAFLENNPDALARQNETAHFTASAWIQNPTRDKLLMVYHNIYHSWAWTGGHADGESDLLSVALREAREETGVSHIFAPREDVFSLEILTVDGHVKRGSYVSSHLHLNLTYLLEADERDALICKPDENKAVRWIPADEIASAVSEPWMLRWIYQKLIDRMPHAAV